MRILAGQEQRPAAFAAAFLKVAGGALQHATRSRDVALLRRLHRAAGLREWARYPLSVAGSASMPGAAQQRARGGGHRPTLARAAGLVHLRSRGRGDLAAGATNAPHAARAAGEAGGPGWRALH
ncbi:MAG: hypothetical protein IPG17_29970 [Sandaracinaceae bacterium]|nr:hypothetical protein [Sandaracinaceae bacterium]